MCPQPMTPVDCASCRVACSRTGAARMRRGVVADDVVQLIHAYLQAPPSASVTRSLSLLMDVNRHDDPRVFAFLLRVLTDRREPVQVRSYTLRCIRTTGLSAANVERAAAAVGEGRAGMRRPSRDAPASPSGNVSPHRPNASSCWMP